MTALLRRRPAAQPEPAAADAYWVTWWTEVGGYQHSGRLAYDDAIERYTAALLTRGRWRIRLLDEQRFHEWAERQAPAVTR
jgi:hypothetical protein